MSGLMNARFHASKLETSGTLSEVTRMWQTTPTSSPSPAAESSETTTATIRKINIGSEKQRRQNTCMPLKMMGHRELWHCSLKPEIRLAKTGHEVVEKHTETDCRRQLQ